MFLACSPSRPVSKGEIGQAEGISAGYVQQLMASLADAGLVRSHRGKAGGFTLARPAEDINVQQVLRATEGPFDLAPCVNPHQHCDRSQTCAAHALWLDATTMVNDLFERTTIADLVESGRLLEDRARGPFS
jgi:Rrf2 family protein